MSKYWILMSDYAAESTTYSVPAGGSVTNPFVPKANGKLIALRLIVVADAATTLTEGVQFKMTNPHFKPNTIEVGCGGGGLQTAPHLQPLPTDYVVDQPIKESSPIVIEARNVTADTPVGVRVLLFGLFEA